METGQLGSPMGIMALSSTEISWQQSRKATATLTKNSHNENQRDPYEVDELVHSKLSSVL